MSTAFDERWKRRALKGDGDAVRRLADEMIRPLYRFCLYRVGADHHLCEDVVQQTLLDAIGKLDQYEPSRCDGHILTWLTGLARNEIRRALSRVPNGAQLEAYWRKMDDQLLSLYAMLETQPFEDDLLERQETRQLVNAAMAQLPAHYGQALEAKYLRGLSVRQVAEALGTTAKAAESTLTRARQAFRETFLALSRPAAEIRLTSL